jgi:transposase-like protein
MKKFKYKRKCPKCKQDDITNMFVKKGKFDIRGIEADRDLIHRYCNLCRYSWNEKVKNGRA